MGLTGRTVRLLRLKAGSLSLVLPDGLDGPDGTPAQADDTHAAGGHLDLIAVRRHQVLRELVAGAGDAAPGGTVHTHVLGDVELELGVVPGRAAVGTGNAGADGGAGLGGHSQQTGGQQQAQSGRADGSTDTGAEHHGH